MILVLLSLVETILFFLKVLIFVLFLTLILIFHLCLHFSPIVLLYIDLDTLCSVSFSWFLLQQVFSFILSRVLILILFYFLILDSNNPDNSFPNKCWSLSCFYFSFQLQILFNPTASPPTSFDQPIHFPSLPVFDPYPPASCDLFRSYFSVLKHLITNYTKMQLEHLANILSINIFTNFTGHKIYLDWSQALRRNHFSSPFHLDLKTTYLRGLEINL